MGAIIEYLPKYISLLCPDPPGRVLYCLAWRLCRYVPPVLRARVASPGACVRTGGQLPPARRAAGTGRALGGASCVRPCERRTGGRRPAARRAAGSGRALGQAGSVRPFGRAAGRLLDIRAPVAKPAAGRAGCVGATSLLRQILRGILPLSDSDGGEFLLRFAWRGKPSKRPQTHP